MIRVETSTGDVKVQRDTVDVVVQSPAVSVKVVREGPQGPASTVPGPQGAPGDLTRPVADALYERKLIDTAVWRVDAGAVGTDGKSLIDLSGGNRPAVFGAGSAAPLVLPFDGARYVHIPAAAGNAVSIAMPGGVAWTATGRDGSTASGTHPSGTFTFSTAGDWTRIVTADGACVLDPRNVNADYTRIRNTGTAGGDWTISRAATGFKAAVVDRPLLLFGNDAAGRAGVPLRTPGIRLAAATSVIAMRRFGTSPNHNHGVLIGSSANQALDQYMAANGGSWTSYLFIGGAAVSIAAHPTKDSGQHTWASVFDGSSPVHSILDGSKVTGAALTKPPVGFSEPITVGTNSAYEFIGAAVFDRALTDAEVAQASAELLGTPHYAQADPHPQYLRQRTSRPNVDDRLVETWDGTKWITTHYDSGWRAAALAANATATVSFARIRRVGNRVTLAVQLAQTVANVSQPLIASLPAGWEPQITVRTLQPRSDGLTVADAIAVRVTTTGAVTYQVGNASSFQAELSWSVYADTTPTSLPGTLLSPAP